MRLNTTSLSSDNPTGFPVTVAQPEFVHAVDVKRVLRNTYALLSMTLLFRAMSRS